MARRMGISGTYRAKWTHLMNRVAARRAAWAKPATAFVSAPEPRTIGSFARGRQLAAGNFMFAGHLLERPDLEIWDLGLCPEQIISVKQNLSSLQYPGRYLKY